LFYVSKDKENNKNTCISSLYSSALFLSSRTDRQVLLWLCYIILIKDFIDAYISHEISMLVGDTEF
jgi:hypothetical protein